MTSRNHALLGILALLWTSTGLAQADGTVTGRCRFEKIKGRPSAGYIELYEWNNYLSSDGGLVTGQSFRCGTGGGGGGYYTFTAPAGAYTMYVSQPEFFARPKVTTDVNILNSQTITINPELNLDYSCYVTSEWTEWASPWYQTFVATGTSINKLQCKIAGWDCSSIALSVHESNGGNVTTWPQVGPTKTAGVGYGDLWVGHRSGDIPTVPGRTYAVKLTGQGGSGPNFAICRRNEDGNGYAGGQAYDAAGNARNMDLHITVFSDNDGTVLPYAKTTTGLDALSDWAGVWGQTFRATGQGLAAADLWYASTTWDIAVRFRVYTNDPGGIQIGPTKTNRGAYRTGGVGLVGVSYAPGEVPLTPGNTYYIEMAVPNDPWGFTPYKFNRAADDYPYGHAYMSSGPRTDVDLSMNIVEYAEVEQPTISRSPATLTASTREGENPSNQTFTVANSGTGTLEYTITDNVAWLSVNPGSGTSTGETDTITVIYDTAGLTAGQYTGTITISDPAATNDPQTIAVTLTVNAATPAGFYQPGWNLTSVPVIPLNSSPNSVFQDLVSLGNPMEDHLYRYDTGLMSYVLYPEAFSSVNRGLGYWLYLYTAPPDTVVSVAGTAATNSVILTLSERWNLIGHPHPAPVLLSVCQVKSGTTTLSFDDAVGAGWVTATMYYWDPGSGYLALNTAGYGDDVSLRPWRGYWIRANIGPLSFIVPKP